MPGLTVGRQSPLLEFLRALLTTITVRFHSWPLTSGSYSLCPVPQSQLCSQTKTYFKDVGGREENEFGCPQRPGVRVPGTGVTVVATRFGDQEPS